MRRYLALLAVVALAAGSGAALAQVAPKTVVGTITALREPAAREPEAVVGCDLRVDRVESEGLKLKVGDLIIVSWQWQQEPVEPRRPGLRTGDQIRANVQPTEGPGENAYAASGAITYLGRGELVKPGLNPVIDLGSPTAKVLVKMLAPLRTECHRQTAELLRALVQREPERVRLQLFDFYSPGGREEMLREGLTCATVLVNNRYEFALKLGEGTRNVQLIHRPNSPGATYNSDDALTVVEQELKRIYGEKPPAQQPCPPPA
jgi:hypothetical protein